MTTPFRTWLNSLTGKTTPADADQMYLNDVGGGASKKLTWANLISAVKAALAPLTFDSANVVSQQNGTNAQTFRVYNTYTDASNYERVSIGWDTNVCKISANAAGTGDSNRNLIVESGAVALNNVNTGNTMWFNFGNAGSVAFQQFGQVYIYDSTAHVKFGNPWDIGLKRDAAGVLGVSNGSTGGGALAFYEQTAPAAPSTNGVRIYAEDNGSGKTRLMALFATGSAVQIAIEP